MKPSGFAHGQDGSPLAWYDFGGAGPPLLLAHATGFHAHTWLPVVARLRRHFRCFAFDMRGHGCSPRPANGDFGWNRLVDDVVTIAGHLNLRAAFAAGHSAGGAAVLGAAATAPSSFAALWTYEPVVYPPPQAHELADHPLAVGARRRRAAFADRAEAHRHYEARAPFSRFDKRVLAAYLDHGLAADPSGGVRLACEPADEAAVYQAAPLAHTWCLLPSVQVPVTTVRGGLSTHRPAQVTLAIVGRLAKARVEELDELTHFGPLEDPVATATSIATSLTY